jgi:hypothetical protein
MNAPRLGSADVLTRTKLQIDGSPSAPSFANVVRALHRMPGVLIAEIDAISAYRTAGCCRIMPSRHQADIPRYCMGVAVLNLEDPSCVLYRTPSPILEPQATYERDGLVSDVVFPSLRLRRMAARSLSCRSNTRWRSGAAVRPPHCARIRRFSFRLRRVGARFAVPSRTPHFFLPSRHGRPIDLRRDCWHRAFPVANRCLQRPVRRSRLMK